MPTIPRFVCRSLLVTTEAQRSVPDIIHLRTAESVEISNDLECGNAGFIHEAEPGRVELGPREDGIPHAVQVKGPISCYSVCLLLKNTASRPTHLTLDVIIPQWLIHEEFGYFLRKDYFERAVDRLEWEAIPASRVTSLPDRMRFDIELRSHEARVFSSIPNYPYSQSVARLRDLAQHPEADLVEIGRSGQGRPVWALEIGKRPGVPRVVVTGTLQPGEPAAWSVMAMVHWLLESEPGHEAVSRCEVDLVPITNPDGNVLGCCNVNSEDAVPVFGFKDAAEGRPCPTETRVVWEYLCDSPPLGYMDFHFLHTPNHPAPKIMFPDWSLYRDPARAALAEATGHTMANKGAYRRIDGYQIGHPLWSGLAVYQAAERLGAVSYVDQYTGPLSSLAGAIERGPAALEAFVDSLCGRT